MIYLVQHGETDDSDPARPLSAKGKEEAERVAKALGTVGLRAKTIMHSGKLRARQTAEIFSASFGQSAVMEMPGLAPNDEPGIAKAFIEKAEEPLMLVGHMPHLSKLASLLVTGKQDQEIIRFRMGGVVCLSRDNGWKILWALTPEITPFRVEKLFPRSKKDSL
ncbi:MAG: phosphohistidine phosphatase SixA [Candidatus Micrarchaeia archaeon]